MEETTKICRVCERKLPIDQFILTRGGVRKNTCRECQNAARRATIEKNRTAIGGGAIPFPILTSTASNPLRSSSLCRVQSAGSKAEATASPSKAHTHK